MSSFPSKFLSNFNEHRWVTQIRQTLEEDQLEDDDNDIVVSIFNVPKTLMAISPDSYTPQQVAIGPYHYWRLELYEMEKYKLSAAKRTRKNLLIKGRKFQDIVQQLAKHEPKIRAHYHKYLDFSGETLAWIMAIDASFLLEFLNLYAKVDTVKTLRRAIYSRMSHLFDHARQKSAHNTILRDIIMLENQIPIFVLRKMLEFQFSTLEEADEVLSSMLLGFCRELSPLKIMEETNILVSDCSHLLDFFYKMVMPCIEVTTRFEDTLEIVEECTRDLEDQGRKKWKEFLCVVLNICCSIWRFVKKLKFPKKWFLILPCRVLSNFPLLSIILKPVLISLSLEKEEIKPEDNNQSNNIKPPLLEEIAIPSVTDLSKSCVHFHPTNGDLSTITFDPKTVTFYLPAITLDVNTEAILRNLVAFEASNASGPLIFTRYTELMNGIIDTDEDVRLLREKGIILNRLKSDEEAANLWNGMSKSIRLTKVPFLDKVIEDVNKYHDGKWKVKLGKFMKLYVFGSWQFLVFLATVWILLFMGFQTFCSVFFCRRFFSSSHR